MSVYDGSRLAKHSNVVVVSVNYRLGALGFMYLPEFGITGNYGTLADRVDELISLFPHLLAV